MTRPTLLIICNALDDSTRQLRKICTDSPAASRKILLLANALRTAGVRSYVLSLGRGKADGSLSFYPHSVRRILGVPVVYAPFSHTPFLSELISLFAFVRTILRIGGQSPKAILFYNRVLAYIPTLIVSSLAGYKNVLELEDGEVSAASGQYMKRCQNVIVRWLFDQCCRGGALIACSALSKMTNTRPVLSYYGTAVRELSDARWSSPSLTFVMAGSLMPETGADTLIRAIELMRQESPAWAHELQFEVTGKGESLNAFKELAIKPGSPKVFVHGRTTDALYRKILNRSEVGLALKPIGGPLADTTFPSKVIEFAGAGLLVLSTDISDVRQVLGEGGFYLTSNNPRDLIHLFKRILDDRAGARICAEKVSRLVLNRCSPQRAGRDVANFIFGREV
jgi:glycosyltransferase involved in cell wall biosynthesis